MRLTFFSLILMVFFFLPQGLAKQNVLFIMADDFNHWLPAIGYYPKAITPNLDKLAEKGVLFTDAHCSSPVCNPSRNAMWSGIRPSTSGITTNGDGYIKEKSGFENIISMHHYFKNNGYYTYGAGKLWHASSMGRARTDAKNWNEINPCKTGSKGGRYYKWGSTKKSNLKWGAGEFNLDTFAFDTKMANQVAEFIGTYSKNNDKPFFIGCGFFRPHLPWHCHKSFFDLYDPGELPIPKGYKENDLKDVPVKNNADIHKEIVEENKWREGIRAYLANLSYADYNIGILLDALKENNLDKNTIVLFMGDHGWHLGEKDHWSKYSVYDQASHTTLIIYDPTAEGNKQKCTKVVSLQDLYPTLIELCGLPKNNNIEGNSLAPLLKKPNDNNWNHPIVISYSNTHIIKTNEWRLIDNGDRNKQQLYHTKSDPYEWNNLYNYEHELTIRHLKHQLDSIIDIGFSIKNSFKANE